MTQSPDKPLRRGWTTGACATAAARAAFAALHGAPTSDSIEIFLPSRQRVVFVLSNQEHGAEFARAGVVKDAGDDPDVTHGALIVATLRRGALGAGVTFKAGPGVGVVTRPGLPLSVGEPAINPVPRRMMQENVADAAAALGVPADAVVEISIPGGEEIAKHTLNGRLGVVGGLSILGTTGIVVPYSCAAWIDSIHRGVDVARACGLTHICAATGSVSENAARALYGLADQGLIEMGDFVGALLKYLRAHPVPRVTLAGGFAKMTKLAQGALDLHSARSTLDLAALGRLAGEAGGDVGLVERIGIASSALEALRLSQSLGVDLAGCVAERAFETARRALDSEEIALELLVFDRDGALLARAGEAR